MPASPIQTKQRSPVCWRTLLESVIISGVSTANPYQKLGGMALLLLLGALTACSSVQAIALPTLIPTAYVPTRVPTLPPATATPSPPPTATTEHTPTPIPTSTVSPTPDPYAGWTIADLSNRSYGGGQPQILDTMATTNLFSRYLITYPSDELTIYGFMNVPPGEGPFPVVLLLHGYVNPANYNTQTYTTTYADALAQAGYLVIHPNFRNYPPSDNGPNEFRAGYAIDVLNLVALVQQQGGRSGPFQPAKPDDISLWGHSMGGGVALRVITINPDIRRTVLYGSMSGDEYKNYQYIFDWTDGRSGLEELSVPASDMFRIAPINHLDRIVGKVSIHHGTADSQVPPAWSTELCQTLQALGKEVECFTYLGQPHFFVSQGDRLFRQRVLDFLDR